MAGKEWFGSFVQRHNLSIRKPEATSLQRATAFNKFNVGLFFEKLKSLYEKYSFDPGCVYNMDETAITTVQVPSKVVSHRGEKHVGRIVSAERGELVTMALAVSATGNMGGPIGCVGTANSSGWMTRAHFPDFLKHFKNHSGANNDRPVLLILDNHDSHLDIDGINNGIALLTIPPHTSHRLQPLDCTALHSLWAV
uniref:HTH CENPB-type domain-containing protein n=1 Tax=Lutzomyia longipalpis TaxID=7200 RepID=A0A1B0CX45_LUTLO